MSDACIGWRTPEPCPAYGEFHGCRLDDGHQARHECPCGALAGAWTAGLRNGVEPCGTNAAYMRHRRAGESPCVQCREAHSAAVQERKRRRRPAA